MKIQRNLDFDAPPPVDESKQVAIDASLPPPPLVRPDRQIVYPDARTHYDWPPAEGLHDRDTITVDRVTDDIDGPAHRFVIKRGDTVEAYMAHDRFHTGRVIGISHAEQKVRVAWSEDSDRGGWWNVGAIYPAAEPEPERTASARPLSQIVEQANDENAPPGGWSESDRVAAPYAFDDFKELVKRSGRHDSFAVYRTDFERVVSSHEAIVAELLKRFKAPQLKRIAVNLGDWGAGRKTKSDNAESIYRKILDYFVLDGSVSYGMGERYEDALVKKVRAVTEESWVAHFESVDAARKEREASLADPQTLADLAAVTRDSGEDALTDEQMARWDALHADLARERRAASGPSVTVAQFESDEAYEIEFTVKEGYHNKERCQLWIVQLGARVEPATFNELKLKAKALGGWYSSFKKADAGFQFRAHDAAAKFTGLLTGDANRTDILAARKERKEQTTAERLHELAVDMLQRSEGTIERSHESLQNTARRADIQAGVRGRAYAEAALARSLHSVADALSRGKAKYLDGIKHRTHLEELDRVLVLAKWARIRSLQKKHREGELAYPFRLDEEEAKPFSTDDIRFAKFPYPLFSTRNLADLVRRCRDKRGMKQLSATLAKRLLRSPEGSDIIAFRHDSEIGLVADLAARAKAAGIDSSRVTDELAHFQRLQRASIGGIHELRAALREYFPHKASVRGDDPVLVAERELIGKQLPGFFPTPQAVIDQMLELAEIQPGHAVLEPSCGKGDIVAAIERVEPQAIVTAIERNRTLADILAAKGIEVEFQDFLEHSGSYDRIVMNPPFENRADIVHVRYAFECLAPGGRLVSVMSESPFFRRNKKSVEFQRWLEGLGGYSLKLSENAFAGADAFRQTGVRTRLVVVDRGG
ncbi:MAG: hypothetical protein CMJ58_01385 [Planctomycetaceae bacterium]|nr:hypothetical protein [Planctomycetaceae bacterium]